MQTVNENIGTTRVTIPGKSGTYGYTRSCRIINNANCKLSIIDGINSLLSGLNEADRKEKMDQLLPICKILVYINTNEPGIKDFLEKNYDIYESVRIPVGYNKGYQYHVFIRNTLIKYANENMRPSEYKKDKSEGGVPKTKIKKVLIDTLKKRRRKNDYVNEFINSL